MAIFLWGFFREQTGQDVTEYTLLLAFVVLISAAMFFSSGQSVSTIWKVTDNNLWKARSLSL